MIPDAIGCLALMMIAAVVAVIIAVATGIGLALR